MSEIPRLTVENYEEAYEFYKHHEINVDLALKGHRLMAFALRPTVAWEPGAEDIVGDWIDGGGQVFLGSHHISNWDTVLPAAFVEQEEALQPMRGKTLIVSKREVFSGPLKQVVSDLGGVPVLRPSRSDNRVTDEIRNDNKEKFIEMVAHRINKGQHVAGFPHGTHSKPPRDKVSHLRPGIFEGILASNEPENFLVLPVGVQYLWWHARPMRKRVHFGSPLHVQRTEDPRDLVDRFQPELQKAVIAARDNR